MRDYAECRPYLYHLRAEHRRLHALLRRLRDALVSSEDPAGSFAESLAELRNELSHHFAEEEGGGCMEEAVSRFPGLSAEAARIEAEHPRILAELDRLIAVARGFQATARNRVAMQEALESFLEQIRAHEHAESDLLRQGFGSDYDVDENGYSNSDLVNERAGP